MKMLKQLVSGALALSMAFGAATFTTADDTVSAANDAVSLVEAMGMGWNLGNTFDSAPVKNWSNSSLPYIDTETGWGNPKTTKAMISAIKNAGFKTVRIPVTWFENMDDSGNVDEDYLARIKEVVDYCIDQDLYAIINVHHDGASSSNGNDATAGATQATITGAWLWQGTSQMTKFANLWTQIANYFKSYDNHLAFAGWNEISLSYKDNLTFGKTFVEAVRATGGNNASRLLIVPANNTNLDAALSSSFQLPTDSADMLAVEIHYYSPPAFSIAEANVTWCTPATTWGTASEVQEMQNDINKLNNTFVKDGIPVIIGECGVLTNEGKDKASIRSWIKTLFETSLGFDGICPVLWDSGNVGDMQYFDRNGMAWFDSEIGNNFKTMTGVATNTTTTYTFDASKYQAEDGSFEYLFDLKPFKGLANIIGFNIIGHGTSTGADACFGVAVQFNGYYTDEETGLADDYHWLVSQISYGYNMASYAFMLDEVVMSDGTNDIGTLDNGYHLSYDYVKLNSWWQQNCSDYAIDYLTVMFDSPIVLDDSGAIIPATETTTTTSAAAATTTTTTTTASSAPETTTEAPAAGGIIWGDANNDGEFAMVDLVMLAKASAGLSGSELSTAGVTNCNLVADSTLNGKDLSAALQLMANLISADSLPLAG